MSARSWRSSSEDGYRMAGLRKFMNPDRRAIKAPSSHNWSHDCFAVMAHDHGAMVAINRPLLPDQTVQFFRAKFPIKIDELSPL